MRPCTVKNDVYDTRGFLAGRSTLYRLDLDVTGDVTGRDLIHLQCHTGMDTLSWLRAGAGSVTGIDFSDIAVAKAAATAEAAGLSDRATFLAQAAREVDVTGRLLTRRAEPQIGDHPNRRGHHGVIAPSRRRPGARGPRAVVLRDLAVTGSAV